MEPKQDLEGKSCIRKLNTPKGNKGKRAESGQEEEDPQRKSESGKKSVKDAIRDPEEQEEAHKRTQRKNTPNHGRKERERSEEGESKKM